VRLEPAAADVLPTLSAGVVEAPAGQTVAELVQASDHRLDEAKRDRNRVAGLVPTLSS
jgi:GGDEF domain-containing protein